MSESFFQRVKSRIAAGGATGPPQILFAAFGKHPCHDEHISDLAQNPKAIAFWDALYTRGIRTVVDSGRWSETEKAGHLEPFNHLLLGSFAGDTVVALIQSSKDSVGRDKYPFIFAALCPNISLADAAEQILPQLQKISRECTVPTSFPALQAVLARARTTLSSLAESPNDSSSPLPNPDHPTSLPEHPALGPDHQGLLRILYQIEYELAPYRSAKPPKTTRPRQLRVPRCSDSASAGAMQWLEFLQSQLDPTTSILAIAPLDRPWVDLLIGTFTDAEIFCLRAAPAVLSLTTDVPYPISEAVQARARELLNIPEAPLTPPSPPAPVSAPPPPPPTLAPPPPVTPPVTSAATKIASERPVSDGPKKPTILAITSAAAVVVIAGIIGYRALHSSTPQVAVVPAPAAPIPSHAPVIPAPRPIIHDQQPVVISAPPVSTLPPDPRRNWNAPAHLNDLARSIQALPESARPALRTTFDSLQSRIAAIKSAPASANLPDDMHRLESDIAQLNTSTIAAAGDVAISTVRKGFLASLSPAPQLHSPTLAKAWTDRSASLASDAETAKDFAPLIQQQQALRGHLVSLDVDPQMNAEAPKSLAGFLEKHRESTFAQILSAPGSEADLKKSHAEYARQVAQCFSALTNAAAQISSGQAVPADPAWPGLADDSLLKDPAFAALISPAASILRSYLQLQNASRSDLILAMSDDNATPINRLTAWRRLSDTKPAWPASPGEFAAEQSASFRLQKDFAPSPAICTELASASPRRLAAFFQLIKGTPSDSLLASLANLHAPTADSIPLKLQYDLLLYDLKQSIPSLKPADQQPRFDLFLADASALQSEPAIAEQIKSLSITASPPVHPSAPATTSDILFPGPSPATWPLDTSSVGDITYKWRRYSIAFKLVPSTNGAPAAYVSTADIPADAFVEWLKHNHFSGSNAGDFSYTGIDLTGTNAGRRSNAPRSWTIDERGPRDGHAVPVQFVPASLALHFAATLGCRLPTEAELHSISPSPDSKIFEFALSSRVPTRSNGEALGFDKIAEITLKSVILVPSLDPAKNSAMKEIYTNKYVSFAEVHFRLAYDAPPASQSPADPTPPVSSRIADAKYLPLP